MNVFEKEGYSFDGWTYGLQILTDGQSVLNLANTQDAEIVLTARWKINEYTMTFKPENGENDTVIKMYYDLGVTAPKDPTLSGYRFDYWMDEEGERATIPTKMPAVNATYTAHWSSYLDLLFAIPITSFDDAMTSEEELAILDTARMYFRHMNAEQVALYKSEAEDSIYAEHFAKLYEVIEEVSRRDLNKAIVEAEDATNATLILDGVKVAERVVEFLKLLKN